MNSLKQYIPNCLHQLAKMFPKDKPLYIVGGFVRDAISFGTITNESDIDLTSALTPPEIIDLLKDSSFKVFETSLKLGTLAIKGDVPHFEYTTFRKDSYPEGSGVHSPIDVVFTNSIVEDAKRRDFKCNAVYYDILKDQIVDPLNGIQEINNKILSSTINPYEVLAQDGLRILRLIRFVSKLGYSVEPETYTAASQLSNRLNDITVERINEELKKIINGKYCFKALSLMHESGILKVILPELDMNAGVEQNPKYHKYDVLTHIFKTVEYATKRVRLPALFHDIAKTYCFKRDGNFHYHNVEGARMTKEIMQHYKFSNEEINYTVELVECHMFDLAREAKPYTIRKFITKHLKYIDEICELRYADALATKDQPENILPDSIMLENKIMIENNIPRAFKEMKINGTILKAIGFQDKQVGFMLQEILETCQQNKLENDEEELFNYAKKRFEKFSL